MRFIRLAFIAAGFVFLSGCGCLETWEDRNLTRYGGGGADPEQPGWHQCLFGTRYIPASPLYGGKHYPQYIPEATE